MTAEIKTRSCQEKGYCLCDPRCEVETTKLNVLEWKRKPNEHTRPRPAGEWDNEPDKIQWIDATTDLDCLMHRNNLGAWCGYVGVPERHPLFAVEYSNADLDVHGGLTYSDFCQDTSDESIGICHVPGDGRPHKVWWLGFDCGHAYDLVPSMHEEYRGLFPDGTYRNRAYVEGEVTKLASQIAALATG